MVNSPSRPNSRPPAPVDCGGLMPLWRRETCLPVVRAAARNQTKSDQIKLPSIPIPTLVRVWAGSPHSPKPGIRARFPVNQASIKAKNPAIVHNQGISRQTAKNESPSPPRHSNPPRAASSAIGCWAFDVGCWMFPVDPNQGKNPWNRASSRHIKANAVFFKLPFIRPTHPLDGTNRQSKGRNVCPGKFLSRGEKQVRASVPLICLAASLCLSVSTVPEIRNPGIVPGFPQSRQKPLQSRLIVPHQGKRQFSGARPSSGAATTKPAGHIAIPKPSALPVLPKIREPGAETRFRLHSFRE